MKAISIITLMILLAVAVSAEDAEKNNPWDQLSFLEGTWEGTGDGISGKSEVTQTFEFILGDNFLKVQTKSVFKPQEKNPKGEVHENLAVFSYDETNMRFVIRAFYVEGFVNKYVLSETADKGNVLIFVTESVENAPAGTKAKLIFEHVSENEMKESFFVAFPGQEFGCFSTNILTKKE